MNKCKGVMVWLGFRLGNKRALPENELCFGGRIRSYCPGGEAKRGAQEREGAEGACREGKQRGSGELVGGRRQQVPGEGRAARSGREGRGAGQVGAAEPRHLLEVGERRLEACELAVRGSFGSSLPACLCRVFPWPTSGFMSV